MVDHGDGVSEVFEVELLVVDAVDEYFSVAGFNDAEEDVVDGGFAGAGSADDSYFFSCVYFEGEVFEGEGEIYSVFGAHAFEFDVSSLYDGFVSLFDGRPVLAVFFIGFFWLDFHEVEYPFD